VTSDPIFDVIIAGGGPAGSALGLLLARAGCSVAVLEKTAYSGFRVGESLPPSVVPRLMRLGLWDSFLQTGPSPTYGVQSAWGTSELVSSVFLGNPFLNGWHLDRSRFDSMLSSAAADAGARIFRKAAVRSVERDPYGRWAVTSISPRGESHFRARFFVNGTGRSSTIHTHLGVKRNAVDRMIGIAVACVAPHSEEPLPSLVESHALGWWYSAGLPCGQAIAIFFTDSDVCARHDLANGQHRLLGQSRHTRARLESSAMGEVRVFPAATHCLGRAAGESWLTIGDAMIGRDPLSSSGIDFALASSERAYGALQAIANGVTDAAASYDVECRSDFASYLNKRRAYYLMEQRWPGSPFWRRRHAVPSVVGLADPLVSNSQGAPVQGLPFLACTQTTRMITDEINDERSLIESDWR